MKRLFISILAAAFGVTIANAEFVAPTRIAGGGQALSLSSGTASFTLTGGGASGLRAYILRSIEVQTAGSLPTGATEKVTFTVADGGITNSFTFNITSNAALSSKGRIDFPLQSGYSVVSSGTNTAWQTGGPTNTYLFPGAYVTVAVGTNGGRASIVADAYSGGIQP